jgi:hypothetical protein
LLELLAFRAEKGQKQLVVRHKEQRVGSSKGGGRKIAVANLLYRAKLACKCLLYYTRAAFWYIRQEIANFSKPPSQQHKSMKNKKKQETKT